MIVSAIIIFSTILRLISIDQSLWLDEATTAIVSQMSLSDFFTRFISADFHPPLYYLVINFWSNFFGTSEIVLRIPSVIFGSLTIYIVYLIAKEIKLKYPIVPALFLATSGLHIYYSQEARMYSLAAFLVSLIVYLFLKKKWLLFSITLPILFLTDYLSILILPALLIYSYFYNRKITKNIISSSIPLVITFFVWFPFLFKQLAAGLALKSSSSNWWNLLGPVTFKNIGLIPIKFMIGRVSMDNKPIYYFLIIILTIIFIYAISKAKNKLVWSWFGISLVLGILISFLIPTLTYFRYLFILPAFYLLLSENTNKILIILILLVNILTSGIYLFNTKFHREDWRGVSKLIGSEKIVFPVNSQKEALTYYGKDKQIISKEELTKSDETFWLSRYVWDTFDENDSTRKFIEELGYNKITEVNLNGILLFKYARSN